MKTLKVKILPKKIEYWPNHSDLKFDYICLFIGIVLLCATYFRYEAVYYDYNDFTFGILLMVGIAAIIVAFYRLAFRDNLMLIFDSDKKAIYKKQPWGLKWKVIDFDEIHSIITETESNHFQYCLIRKKNIFGKNIKISESFSDSKPSCKRSEYEEKVLPAIMDMIGIAFE